MLDLCQIAVGRQIADAGVDQKAIRLRHIYYHARSMRACNANFLPWPRSAAGSSVPGMIPIDNSSALANPRPPITYAQLRANAVTGIGVSEWLRLDQVVVSAFGELTRDPDPNHIDPAWARDNSPFGGPIAFGFQTLAMLTWFLKSAGMMPSDASHVVNYGFDRVRFVAPWPVGARARGEFEVASVARRSDVQILVSYDVAVRIDGGERPLLRALWLALYEGPGERG